MLGKSFHFFVLKINENAGRNKKEFHLLKGFAYHFDIWYNWNLKKKKLTTGNKQLTVHTQMHTHTYTMINITI